MRRKLSRRTLLRKKRMKKITHATIGPMPRPLPEGLFDPMPEIRVTYGDGTTEGLLTFYPDELSFVLEEFIGLTRAQALDLRTKKDIHYLQS